jgi:hypothetical protein
MLALHLLQSFVERAAVLLFDQEVDVPSVVSLRWPRHARPPLWLLTRSVWTPPAWLGDVGLEPFHQLLPSRVDLGSNLDGPVFCVGGMVVEDRAACRWAARNGPAW